MPTIQGNRAPTKVGLGRVQLGPGLVNSLAGAAFPHVNDVHNVFHNPLIAE